MSGSDLLWHIRALFLGAANDLFFFFLPVWFFLSPSLPPARNTGSASGCPWSSLCAPRPAAAAVSSGSRDSVACGACRWGDLSAAERGAAGESWLRLGRRGSCPCHGLDPSFESGRGPCSCPCHAFERTTNEATMILNYKIGWQHRMTV